MHDAARAGCKTWPGLSYWSGRVEQKHEDSLWGSFFGSDRGLMLYNIPPEQKHP